MNLLIKSKLDNIFYGNNLLSRGFDDFYNLVKKSKLNIEKPIVKFYYDNQQIVQIFKPNIPRKNMKYIPIISDAPFEVVYCDTMFITSVNLTIVNFVDLFSKFGYSKSFRGQSISSSKTTDVLYKFLKSVIKLGYYPNTIRCDDGSEFKGEFRKECKQLDIQIQYQDPNDKLKTSPIEAFNRTIRLSIEKTKSILESGTPITAQIEKALTDINLAYNNIPHSSTGYSPMDILKDREIEDIVAVKNNIKKQDALDSRVEIGVGSYVRIAINNNRKPFQKLTPSYSKEIYKVKKYDSTKNRYILEGIDGFFEYWKLQVVDKDNLMKHTTDRYVVSNPVDDDVRQSRATRVAEKEVSDYLTGPVGYSKNVEGKRNRKKKVITDV